MATRTISKICSVEGCLTDTYARDVCNKHYQRALKHGDVNFVGRNMGEGSTAESRFWSRIALTADIQRCWIWLGAKNKKGYGHLGYNKKKFMAHRLAWFLVKGEHPQQDLLHSCPGGDNPACCNPEHLREGTDADNARDRVERGRLLRGEDVAQSKLTEIQVIEIKRRLAVGGETQRQLGLEFGVGQSAISAIGTGQRWSHIEPQ